MVSSSVVDLRHFGTYPESGSSDPYHWLTGPALFVSLLKGTNKKYFFPLLFKGAFTSFLKDKKSKSFKFVKNKVFLISLKDPDPYLWLTDPQQVMCVEVGCTSACEIGGLVYRNVYMSIWKAAWLSASVVSTKYISNLWWYLLLFRRFVYCILYVYIVNLFKQGSGWGNNCISSL
jgi:hypothetical protein